MHPLAPKRASHTHQGERSMDRNIGWITNIVFLIFGIVFFVESLSVPPGPAGLIGPRTVPLSISIIVIFVGALLIYFDMKSAKRSSSKQRTPASHDSVASVKKDITPRELIYFAGPVFLLTAVYGVFLYWFGYLLSTWIVALVGFSLFHNSKKIALINAIVGSLIFYYLFIKLMGVYDPPGRMIDLSGLLHW